MFIAFRSGLKARYKNNFPVSYEATFLFSAFLFLNPVFQVLLNSIIIIRSDGWTGFSPACVVNETKLKFSLHGNVSERSLTQAQQAQAGLGPVGIQLENLEPDNFL